MCVVGADGAVLAEGPAPAARHVIFSIFYLTQIIQVIWGYQLTILI